VIADKVFFDARYIRFDHHDGISRFSAALFAALSMRTKVVAVIYDLRQLEKLPQGTEYVMANDPTSWREPFIASTLNRAGAKVVFSPMQTMGSFGRKYKLILTLHDLIYYNHKTAPAGFNLAIRVLWRLYHLSFWPQRLLLNRADAVATVSESTKRLMQWNELTKRPISVIYNAAGSPTEDTDPKPPTARPKAVQSLVYMGSFIGYKNVEVLIDGMQYLPDYELNLLSKISTRRKAELESLVSPTGGKVIFHNGVSETAYHQQLDRAVALVSGSQDEGFGIPLVEAMSRGIPVVVSDIEIFREIGGSVALYFDQNSGADFANQVQKLKSNPAWLERSKASLKWSRRFNWNQSAGALMRVISEL
jgi:glycosyltransferase involved in cell wall biosynthesis